MCLVFFAWLTDQQYFKDLTDEDIRKRLYETQKETIDADMSPFGFIAVSYTHLTLPTILLV